MMKHIAHHSSSLSRTRLSVWLSSGSLTVKNKDTYQQKQFESKVVVSGQYGSVPTFVVDYVCKIRTNEGVGSGFVAEFELNDRYMYGIFTCNHVLGSDYLRENGISCSVDRGSLTKRFHFHRSDTRFTFTDRNLDATFVELFHHEVTVAKQFGMTFLRVARDKDKLKKGKPTLACRTTTSLCTEMRVC